MVYRLDNDYLVREEKALVEGLYQLPLGVLHYTALGFLVWDPTNMLQAWIAASAASTVAALVVWKFASERLASLGFVFGGRISTIVCLTGAVWFAYNGHWGYAVIMALASIGLLAIVAPSTWLFSILSRDMHPKYALAKRLFLMDFPFEEHTLDSTSGPVEKGNG